MICLRWLPVVLLAGCVGTPQASPPAMSARPTGSCGDLSGWEDLAAKGEGKVVLFGEWHGTNEMPEAFFRYVCKIAESGRPIVVGLEVDSDDDAALGSGFELPASEAAGHWRRKLSIFRGAAVETGQGSEAMMTLLLDLKELIDRDWPVEVRAVAGRFEADDTRIGRLPHSQSRRFGRDAQNLLVAAARYEHAVMYAGNLHARNAGRQQDEKGSLFDRSRFVRIDYSHAGGAAKNCLTVGGCGENASEPAMRGPADGDLPVPSIVLDPDAVPSFDGYYYVGSITPAPPLEGTTGGS